MTIFKNDLFCIEIKFMLFLVFWEFHVGIQKKDGAYHYTVVTFLFIPIFIAEH